MTAPPVPWHSTGLHRDLGSVEEVLDRSLGIYATQPTGHLELLARLDDYGLDELTRVVEDDRSALRMSSLRGSSFVLPVGHLPAIVGATGERRRRSLATWLLKDLETPYETWVERILPVVRGRDLAPTEIRGAVADDDDPDASRLRYVLSLMAYDGLLVSARSTGSWRSDRTTYAVWEEWLPGVDPWAMDPDDARAEVARLYLDRHGPATVDDLSFWSGLPKRQSRTAIEAVGRPLAGHDGWWHTGEVEEHDAPDLRLLPIWDTLWVTYRDRSRFLDEDRYPYVYDRDGNATSIVLLDGRPAGQWDLGKDDTDLVFRVAPFTDWPRRVWNAVGDEVDRIAALISAESVTVDRGHAPVDLTTAPRNAFMSPLKDR